MGVYGIIRYVKSKKRCIIVPFWETKYKIKFNVSGSSIRFVYIGYHGKTPKVSWITTVSKIKLFD